LPLKWSYLNPHREATAPEAAHAEPVLVALEHVVVPDGYAEEPVEQSRTTEEASDAQGDRHFSSSFAPKSWLQSWLILVGA
jgi:hypothetical protein